MTDAPRAGRAVPVDTPLALSEAGVAGIDEARLGVLHALIDLLLQANAHFNLTAVRDPAEAWNKHIVDSLQGLTTGLFERSQKVIDIGTGAGFPALALSAARPQLIVTALDSTRKKCDFVGRTAHELRLAVTPLCARAEEVGHDTKWRATFDVATARAVGSLCEVCELALPLVREGGHLVLWRGREAEAEVAAGAKILSALGADCKRIALNRYHLPHHDLPYHLVTIPKSRATPVVYPRRTALLRKSPL